MSAGGSLKRFCVIGSSKKCGVVSSSTPSI
jgi:hypothetical protein